VTSAMKRLLAVAAVVLAVAAGGVIYMAVRPSNAWPLAFCQPIDRVIGVEALQVTEDKLNSSAGKGIGEDVAQLRHDVEVSFANAPTFELRSELASYDDSIGSGKSAQVEAALSHFDELASTQLERCGIQPIQPQGR
jgi:hypothetical protein